MKPIRCTVLPWPLLLAAALGLQVPSAAQVKSYLLLSHAEHQTVFDSLKSAGYRIRSISVSGSSSSPKYTAVWEKKSGPSWVAFHGKSLDDYLLYDSAQRANGYNAVLLSATGSGSGKVYAGVYEKDGIDTWVSPSQSESGFRDNCTWALQNDYILVSVGAFDDGYAAVYKANAGNVAWGYSVDDTRSEYQDRFDAHTSTWVRCALVVPNASQRYAAIWHDESIGSWEGRHNMTQSECEAAVRDLGAAGYVPLSLQAGGTGSGTRFAGVFAKSAAVAPRSWSVAGTEVSELRGFDDWMYDRMKAKGIRGGALAIARNGRLAFARGYTLAESGYPAIQPTSLFRIASCSKPLTSIAIHQCYERGLLKPSDAVWELLGLDKSKMADRRTADVTLDHLLTHEGGWDRDATFDPMHEDIAIADFYKLSLPIHKLAITKYMTEANLLQFAPGTSAWYSNYGFMLAGRCLEAAHGGKQYFWIMKNGLLDPLGLTRPQIGEPLLENRASGEVRYHRRQPYVTASRMHADQRLIASQYGQKNLANGEATGGWVLAAPDFAKVLAAFDLGDQNPILSSEQTAAMWTESRVYGRGWDIRSRPDASNKDQQVVRKGGAMSGTTAQVIRRADGLSFVVLFNSENGDLGSDSNTELNDLANSVKVWPIHDLFPSCGIPAIRRPLLTGASVARVANVGTDPLVLLGDDLAAVRRVHLGSRVIESRPTSDLSVGYFQVVGGRLWVYPPQGMLPGKYALRLDAGCCASSSVQVELVLPGAPVLVSLPQVVAGNTLELIASRGPLSVQCAMYLVLSGVRSPTAVPGLITLDIGGQFSSWVPWPQPITTDRLSGVARWSLSTQPSWKGLDLFAQVGIFDPVVVLPPMHKTGVAAFSLR